MTRTSRTLTTTLVVSTLLAAIPTLSLASTDALRTHVETLASPEFEGRLTGSAGEAAAAAYLAEQLQAMGAQPLVGKSFEVPFEFTAGSRDTGSQLTATGNDENRTWSGSESIQALSFSDSGTVSGEVVFAGYGLVVPDEDFAYDSYATLDVEDKVVVVLRYFPEDADPKTRALLARYSGLRYKALQARERGAKALLVVTGPNSPNAGETVPMSFDTAIAGSGILAASISGEVAAVLLDGSPKGTLAEVQTSLDTANPHVAGFVLPDTELELEVAVEREKKNGRNVLGWFPAETEPASPGYVVLGAHYDHLGRGRSGNSLARKEEAQGIHYGADDNASGVAAVLEATRELRSLGHDRHLVVALWSGEELGVLGSSAFLRDEVLPQSSIAAYLNFDMVGRLEDDGLHLQAVGSCECWTGWIEPANVPVGLDLHLTQDPYLPTDSSPFNQAEIPTLNFFTGSHEDYHRPTDTAEKIDYDGLAKITRFGALLARRVANSGEAPVFVKIEPTARPGGDRDTVRAFTGTIPDYSTEAEGLLLSGVIEGGPADQAGLQGGDVIVAMGEQTIANIYDYTYALDAVKIDVPTKVVFVRDGERHETTITPTTRD